MQVNITGTLRDPLNQLLATTTIRFTAITTAGDVHNGIDAHTITDTQGQYDLTLAYGRYRVEVLRFQKYLFGGIVCINESTHDTDLLGLLLNAAPFTPDITVPNSEWQALIDSVRNNDTLQRDSQDQVRDDQLLANEVLGINRYQDAQLAESTHTVTTGTVTQYEQQLAYSDTTRAAAIKSTSVSTTEANISTATSIYDAEPSQITTIEGGGQTHTHTLTSGESDTQIASDICNTSRRLDMRGMSDSVVYDDTQHSANISNQAEVTYIDADALVQALVSNNVKLGYSRNGFPLEAFNELLVSTDGAIQTIQLDQQIIQARDGHKVVHIDTENRHITFDASIDFTNTDAFIGEEGWSYDHKFTYSNDQVNWSDEYTYGDIWRKDQKYKFKESDPTNITWVGEATIIQLNARDGHDGDNYYIEYQYTTTEQYPNGWHSDYASDDDWRRWRTVRITAAGSEYGDWQAEPIKGTDGPEGWVPEYQLFYGPNGSEPLYTDLDNDGSLNEINLAHWHPNLSNEDLYKYERRVWWRTQADFTASRTDMTLIPHVMEPWVGPVTIKPIAGEDYGYQNAILFLFQRAKKKPTVEPGNWMYTFSTDSLVPVVAGQDNGWHTAVYAGAEPLWVATARASSINDVDGSIDNWDIDQLTENGMKTSTASLYQVLGKDEAAPQLPTQILDYDFATLSVTGAIDNGWNARIPDNLGSGKKLWLTFAPVTAEAFASVEPIAVDDWEDPIVLTQNGIDGQAGLIVRGFWQVGTTTPAKPSGTDLVKVINAGWSETPPVSTEVGKKAYVTYTYAANETTKVGSGYWADPAIWGGTDGSTIYREYQHSKDGADWHSDLEATDIYQRHRTVTNGVGGDWSEKYIISSDDVYTEYQYSSNNSSWHDDFGSTDYYRRERHVTSNRAGTLYGDWTKGVRIRQDGDDGYTPQKGVDYWDGIDGSFVSYVYRLSNDSSTPSGGSYDGTNEVIPTDWSDNPVYSATTLTQVSTCRYRLKEGSWERDPEWSASVQYLGKDGINGVDGKDGKTYYTWIKYADNAQGGGISNSPSGKAYIGLAHNKNTAVESNTASDYTWSLIKGSDGQDGINGVNGVAGVNGTDGKTTYFHTAYADNMQGGGFSQSPTNKTHIGTYVDYSSTDSTDPKEYKWALFKGLDGTDGIAGVNGTNGKTTYLHIAYADTATGGGFSQSPSNKTYLGQYTDYTKQDSSDPTKYKWSLIKGADGLNGSNGINGVNGTSSFFHVAYADSDSGDGFSQSAIGKTYIGTYVDSNLQDSTDPKDYKWALFKGHDGTDGIAGVNGDNGKTTYLHIAYADNINGGGFSQSALGKAYLGTYTDYTQQDSNTPSDYTWAKIKGDQGVAGAVGSDGTTYWTWIKYSDNSDGSGLYDEPKSTTKYIGIAPNKTTSTESDEPSDYKWSLFKGDDGVAGVDGAWVSYIFTTAKSIPKTPTGGSYNGSTEVVPTDWKDNPYYTEGQVTYVSVNRYIQADAGGEWKQKDSWSTPIPYSEKGDAGIDGMTVRAVYQNAKTPPKKPTGKTIPPTGWTTLPSNPSKGYYTYVSYTYADSVTATTGNGDWTDVIRLTGADGANGTNGTNGSNGINGTNGKHGSGSYVFIASKDVEASYTDTDRNDHIKTYTGRDAQKGDISTYTDSTTAPTYSKCYHRESSKWAKFSYKFDGSVIVNGTLAAESLKSESSITDKLYISSASSKSEMTLCGTNEYRLWAGDTDPTKAPFSVKKDGSIVANNASIAGSIEASSLKANTAMVETLHIKGGAVSATEVYAAVASNITHEHPLTLDGSATIVVVVIEPLGYESGDPVLNFNGQVSISRRRQNPSNGSWDKARDVVVDEVFPLRSIFWNNTTLFPQRRAYCIKNDGGYYNHIEVKVNNVDASGKLTNANMSWSNIEIMEVAR